MNETAAQEFAQIPLQTVGPVKIVGSEVNAEVMVPLATYESPLWPSVNRGARVSMASGGIIAVIVDERMTRSILLEAPNAEVAVMAASCVRTHREDLAQLVSETSRFARLLDIHTQIVGNLMYVRFEFSTGDAAGHNMVTAASERLLNQILQQYRDLKYVSISGNYCTDKKASAVNGILGRGKNVVTELTVPRRLCEKYLKTTPEKIVDLNIKKNLIGTMIAGGLRSANAHFANMLLGFYLATGQDAANIIEGSQGFVHAEVRGEDLYFSATLPNVIVGTVGNGKELAFVRKNLELLGCTAEREPGKNARRLAIVCAATVLCGELSLLAAQTNPGELMKAHVKMERKK
ncbi:MAG TPA: hydroxymethylglutaryl-CoA reductase [Verrucomicrobia bacterium]|nr:MAG: hydroxymethylglutaryl-CoA reductase [Lentisphaerae bacterium GWF2_57_35]HBA85171.1 hydroxymethylglutaryl-CoA reductase [Verrucomicrobiota bacterium]